MTSSLAGDTIPEAGTPGQPNCTGKTVSAMAHEFGGIHQAALSLGVLQRGRATGWHCGFLSAVGETASDVIFWGGRLA
jgi:hypothetical protein